MPAIRASQKNASSIAAALKNGKGAQIAKDVAERCFLPAFGQATKMVAIPLAVDKKVQSTTDNSNHHDVRRNFCSVTAHEHDKIRYQGSLMNNGELVDYWKAHQCEHLKLNHGDLVDYWKDHMDSHLDSNLLCQTAMRRNFSIKPRFPSSKFDGPEIDYWSAHNDTHFSDYWEEQPNTHL
jgi:hypothetical protein